MTSSRPIGVASALPARGTALVRAAIAPMHAEPRVSSGQTSQLLAGAEVEVVEEQGDWRHVRGDDRYPGWVHVGYLDADSRATTSADQRQLSLGCTVRRGQLTRALPLGAIVGPGEELVDGEVVQLGPDLARRFPRADAASIVRTAGEFFGGTSYQWGGVTPWGADCSGLVQSVFRLHGHVLPRDAWQQALEGDAAEADLEKARAGDLLFFSDRDDRRVTHVGIATGDGRMAHIALGRGGFTLEALLDTRDPYVAALRTRFQGTRRIIG